MKPDIFLLIFIFLISSSVGNGLQVSIATQPPPPYFSGSTLYYYVGSPLILTCEVTGSTSDLHYTWTSTCSGDCFVLGRKVDRVFGNSLEMVDSGVHTCTVCDDNEDCGTANITLRVTGSLDVSISVSYTPPDQYPDHSPPDYRAASSVQLTCVVSGSTGSVAYHWSSTCRDCFASNSSFHSVSEYLLRSRDAGIHTCTVTDSVGNRGSASIEMNIVGIGIHLFQYYRGVSNGSNPNNTYSEVDTAYSSSVYQRLGFYCCSNSTGSNSLGSLRIPSGTAYYSDFQDFKVSTYLSNSRFAGCMRVTITTPFFKTYSLPESGVYACQLLDSRGRKQEATIGLYPRSDHGNSNPILHNISYRLSSEAFTVTCLSSGAPPTNISWYRNGRKIDIDGEVYTLSQLVTNYQSSSYDNTLTIRGIPLKDMLGTYYCQISNGNGRQKSSDIIFQVPDDWGTLHITTNLLSRYATNGRSTTLLCTVTILPGLKLFPSLEWVGPNGTVVTDEGNQTRGRQTTLSLSFVPVITSDKGRYMCRANLSVPGIERQPPQLSTSFYLRVISFNVSISISYTPPDQYPDYSPPNYRAASSVQLNCVVSGSTGTVTYHWSSTCRDCFASNSRTSSISEDILTSRDAGIHTCTATDSLGNRASASIQMNIVGIGIHIATSHSSFTTGASPNNTYAVIISQYYYRYSRLDLYCCSNSSLSSVGLLKTPSGYNYSSGSHNSIRVAGFQSNSRYTGCIQVTVQSSYFSLREPGIYTCQLPDSSGHIQEAMFGLYTSRRNPTPYNISLRLSPQALTITCQSQHGPPTNIFWYRNGRRIDIDGDIYRVSQQVRNFVSSQYDNSLSVRITSNVSILGTYYCRTAHNSLTGFNSSVVSIRGPQIRTTKAPSNLEIGSQIGFTCFSDVDFSYLEWYRGNTLLAKSYENDSSIIHYLVSTDDEGLQYKCSTIIKDGSLDKSITLSVTIPESWGIIGITTNSRKALNGSNFTLFCTVRAISGMRLTPSMEWVGPDGTVVTNTGKRTVTEVKTRGTMSTFSLSFDPILTSDGGMYTCRAAINVPWMQRQPQQLNTTYDIPITTAGTGLQVQVVTSNSSSITRPPFYTKSSPLTLSCEVKGNSSGLHYNWTSNCLGGCFVSGKESDQVSTDSLELKDSGVHTCTACDDSGNCDSDSIPINVIGLDVSISVSYTPPDQYPDYSPPDYRAATSVQLTCVVSGSTGSVAYHWSSTCRDCFASNSSSHSVSEYLLRSHDAGIHTCTVTDSFGNRGSASIEMNIVGIGIHLLHSHSGFTSGSSPNNSYAMAYRKSRYTNSGYTNSTLLAFYCCSNSTSSNVGSLRLPSGNMINATTQYLEITKYRNGGSYAGCMRVVVSNSLRATGVYTCLLPDSEGRIQETMIGLYFQGYSPYSSSVAIQRVPSTRGLTLNIRTTGLPPTNIIWYKNGEIIDIDGDMFRLSQRVAIYSSTNYDNTLMIKGNPEDMIGRYTCRIGSKYTYAYYPISGLRIQGTVKRKTYYSSSAAEADFSRLEVGQELRLECSSDLDARLIELFRNGMKIASSSNSSSISFLHGQVSTDDEGLQYTCRVTSPYAVQEKNITLSVMVPSNWARVIRIIPNFRGYNAVHGRNVTLVCNVTVIDGVTLTPLLTWMGPDGAEVVSEGNRTVGETVTQGTVSTRSLTFYPVTNGDGGRYTCLAKLSAPQNGTQPQRHISSFNFTVVTHTPFQLRILQVPNCNQFSDYNLERSIKRGIVIGINQRCGCNFKTGSIIDGEFRCQSSTSSILYRATIEGSTDTLTAKQLMVHIDDWKMNKGSFLYQSFRLQIDKRCPLHIKSFSEEECK